VRGDTPALGELAFLLRSHSLPHLLQVMRHRAAPPSHLCGSRALAAESLGCVTMCNGVRSDMSACDGSKLRGVSPGSLSSRRGAGAFDDALGTCTRLDGSSIVPSSSCGVRVESRRGASFAFRLDQHSSVERTEAHVRARSRVGAAVEEQSVGRWLRGAALKRPEVP
jgi:hypothetical protein